jgi:tetratricopeptide (TPR) repeat protein
VTATDEAILLYLQALNTDLADRALALKLMVEIQMRAGEFDKALESARQATRTARGLSASLRERLADTRRDVGTVDWHGSAKMTLVERGCTPDRRHHRCTPR